MEQEREKYNNNNNNNIKNRAYVLNHHQLITYKL